MVTTVAHLLVLLLATSTGVWPLDPRPDVADGFAPPTTAYGAGHRGVDLRGQEGQQVLAAEDGVVIFAGSLAGRGVVVVAHGATRTTYEPVAASVEVGRRVTAGWPVGTLERFGSHCWPRVCLHWGLLEGKVYLDPLSLVEAGPVRLLPLTAGVLPTPPRVTTGPEASGPPHLSPPGGRGLLGLW